MARDIARVSQPGPLQCVYSRDSRDYGSLRLYPIQASSLAGCFAVDDEMGPLVQNLCLRATIALLGGADDAGNSDGSSFRVLNFCFSGSLELCCVDSPHEGCCVDVDIIHGTLAHAVLKSRWRFQRQHLLPALFACAERYLLEARHVYPANVEYIRDKFLQPARQALMAAQLLPGN
jgi:hypothetical protein